MFTAMRAAKIPKERLIANTNKRMKDEKDSRCQSQSLDLKYQIFFIPHPF